MGKDRKRIQKNKQKKRARGAKRKRKVVRNEVELETGASRQVMVSAMGNVEAPSGFRAVSFGQAMGVVSDAVRKRVLGGDEPFDSMEQAQQVMSISQIVWNCTQASVDEGVGQLRAVGAELLGELCDVESSEAESMFDEFCQFSVEMIPPDIQPRGTSFTFVRNTETEEITGFSEADWGLSDESVAVQEADHELLKDILYLDNAIDRGDDFEAYEELAIDVEERLVERFCRWLERRGMQQVDPACEAVAALYATFVYRYELQFAGYLGKMFLGDLEEFLFDYLIRMINMPANDFAKAPAVLRLLIGFLDQIGYSVDRQGMVEQIAELEGEYTDMLRERFQAAVA